MGTASIREVEFFDDYKIYIHLTNDHAIIYDLKKKLNTARFTVLSCIEVFKKGKLIQNKIIRWDESTEISLEEIMTHITMKVQASTSEMVTDWGFHSK